MRLAQREAGRTVFDYYRADAAGTRRKTAKYQDMWTPAGMTAKRLLSVKQADPVSDFRARCEVSQRAACLRLGQRKALSTC